jgi:hypothetical protein
MGDERLQRSGRAVLGPQHGTCSDDAPGTQKLGYLGRTEPYGQLLRDRKWR